MSQSFVGKIQSAWPKPDGSGRYVLKPSFGKTLLWFVFLLALAAGSYSVAVHPRRQLDYFWGPVGFVLFSTCALMWPFALLKGSFDLIVDESGFADGKSWRNWANISGPFYAANSRFKLTVHFTLSKGKGEILNCYALSAPALAAFMNERLSNFDRVAKSEPLLHARPSPVGTWITMVLVAALPTFCLMVRLNSNVHQSVKNRLPHFAAAFLPN